MNHPLNSKEENLRKARSRESELGTAVRDDSKDEITISELREIIARRRVPLLLCVAVSIVVAFFVSMGIPVRYEAVSRLSVDSPPSISSGVEALAQAAGVVDPTTLETQVSVLQSDSLAWDVIRALRLDQRLETLPRKYTIGSPVCQSGAAQSIDTVGVECRQILLDEFHKRLHVQAVPRTDIIEIRYRCRSRYLAAEVVDTLSSLYIEHNFESKYQSATKNSAWLGGQLDSVRKDAVEASRRLIEYQEKTGAVGVDGAPNLVLSQLTGLNQQLIVAEAERIVQEARYKTAMTGDPEALINISQGGTLQILHTQEATLQNQYAELDSQLGEAYPKVVQIKEQLTKVREELKSELAHTTEKIKNEYEAAKKAENLLRDEVEQHKQLVYDSTKAGVEMSLLNRDMEASGELYKQVIKRLKTGGILATGNGPDITVLDPASIPLRRIEPRTFLNVLGGFVVGLILGVALCGLLEGFDSRIATTKDVAELCPISGMEVIPCIPEDARSTISRENRISRENSLIESEGLNGIENKVADAYRSLRTSLLHASTEVPPKVILVTSSLSGEGATVISANLAVAFANMNRRVLLVDADLRRNIVGQALHLPKSGGLTEALKGADYHSFCSVLPKIKHLTVLCAGTAALHPPDLLDSARMRELMAQWREEYDQVIVDLPRLTDQSDAVILSTMADTVLLTVRAGRGRRNDLLRAKKILSSVGANLHGAVVTDLRTRGFFARLTNWHGQPFNGQRTESYDASL